MTTPVTRYRLWCAADGDQFSAIPAPHGEYVMYSDYDRVEAERDAAIAEIVKWSRQAGLNDGARMAVEMELHQACDDYQDLGAEMNEALTKVESERDALLAERDRLRWLIAEVPAPGTKPKRAKRTKRAKVARWCVDCMYETDHFTCVFNTRDDASYYVNMLTHNGGLCGPIERHEFTMPPKRKATK